MSRSASAEADASLTRLRARADWEKLWTERTLAEESLLARLAPADAAAAHHAFSLFRLTFCVLVADLTRQQLEATCCPVCRRKRRKGEASPACGVGMQGELPEMRDE